MMKKLSLILTLVLLSSVSVWCKPLVSLQNIRFYTYQEYTRVVLDFSEPLDINEKILPGTDNKRIYFDIEKCMFGENYPDDKKKEIAVAGGHLKRIRIAPKNKYQMRIVFDFKTISRYTKFYLTSPFRVVFDVYYDPALRSTLHEDNKETSYQTNPPVQNGTNRENTNTDAPPEKESENESPEIPIPTQPTGNDYSIVRQLGLGVRTIVIDSGHGGKDPGAVSTSLKIYEKTITLDIALRLKKLLHKNHPQYKIILTRAKDKYISLEERTAIANSSNGDLFISIHLNSAPRKTAQGVETYFLSMTTDPWAMQVAAQENAMTEKSIGEMSAIVSQIVKYARISESKILTGCLQENLVQSLLKNYQSTKNLGVKKAPFIVLAGARMPAALVEVSFMSHPQEGKLLKQKTYRATIANGLYNGIISYINSLGKK